MLENIFGLTALMFMATAVGLFLLNFRAIVEYALFVVSTMVQPKEIYESATGVEEPVQTKRSFFNPLTIFVQIWTLIRVLFFPNLTLRIRRQRYANLNEGSDLQKITSDEIAKYQIKSYTADKNAKVKASYEPVTTPVLSSEFEQLFPEFKNKRKDQLQGTVTYVSVPPQVGADEPAVPEPIIVPTIALNRSETTISLNTNTLPSADSMPTTPIQETVPSSPPLPQTNPIPQNALQSFQEFTKSSSSASMPNVQSTLATPPLPQNRNIPAVTDSRHMPTLTLNINPLPPKAISEISKPSTPNPVILAQTKPIQTFQSGGGVAGASTLKNISSTMGMFVVGTILCLPIITLVLSIVFFLLSVNFDITRIGSYPEWTSGQIESFAKNKIIPAMGKEK